MLLYPLDVCLLMRGRKGIDLDERGGREAVSAVEGQETVVRICYVRKDMLSIKGKIHLELLGLVHK